MTNQTRKIAMFRHSEREKLMPTVKKALELFAQETKVDLFPPTLRQVAMFLRYGKIQQKAEARIQKAYVDLIGDLQESLTYRQGKSVIGMAADPEIENWKTSAGREAAGLLQKLHLL